MGDFLDDYAFIIMAILSAVTAIAVFGLLACVYIKWST